MYTQEDFHEIINLLLHNAISRAIGEPGNKWGKEVIEFLISKGADVNVTDFDYPLLSIAAMGSRVDLVEILIENGAKIDTVDYKGSTALHRASEHDSPDAAKTVEYLISKGAVVNTADMEGRTPLHWAEIKETAEVLLENGAKLDSMDLYGETPLHNSAKAGKGRVTRLLVSRGADKNKKDHTGRTPLHWAVESCSPCAQYLIEVGANLNIKDDYEMTPLDLAEKDSEIYQLLIKNGAKHVMEI